MFLQAHIFLQALSIVHSSYFRGTLTGAYYITGALIYICATLDVENYRRTCILQAHMIVVLDLISRLTGLQAPLFLQAHLMVYVLHLMSTITRALVFTGAHDCSFVQLVSMEFFFNGIFIQIFRTK